MNGNLMDTNVIVRVLNGDRELINELSKISSLCTCTVVLGELTQDKHFEHIQNLMVIKL